MRDERFERDQTIALRVIHTRLAKLKLLFDRDSSEFRTDSDQLLCHLVDLLLPYAHEWITGQPWVPGQSDLLAEAEDLAQKAATLGSGRIGRCSVYFVSLRNHPFGLFWSWFRDARRRMLRLERLPEETLRSPEDPWDLMRPARFTLLVRLLQLSRRSWTYAALFEARDSRRGMIGNLSDCYLGRTANDGSRQARLSPLLEEWEQVCAELESVFRGEVGDLPRHTVARFIAGLDSPDTPAGKSECETVLDELLDQGARGFISTSFKTLALGLQRAADRFRDIHLNFPTLICAAADELGGENDTPGSRLPPAGNIACLLTKLEPDIPLEHDPAHVLNCIGAQLVVAKQQKPVVHPPGRGAAPRADPRTDVIPDSIRLALTLSQCDANDPEWDIIVNLGIGHGLGALATGLAGYLPGPNQLGNDLLGRMSEILADWVDELTRGNAPDDVVAGLRGCVQTELGIIGSDARPIAEARQLVQDWRHRAAIPPSSWSALPPEIKPVVQGALLVALISRVHDALRRLYEADKSFRTRVLDAPDLLESILGPDWVEPKLHPAPAEVRKRLLAKVAGQSIHVMTIRSLDADRFVTGDTKGTVCLWSTESGNELRLLAKHRQGRSVFALEVFPSGLVAAGRDDGTVVLWDPVKDPDGHGLMTLEDHGGFVLSLARLGDERLVAGDASGQVVVWDTSSGRRVERRPAHAGVARALVTKGRSEIFSGGREGSIEARDPDSDSIKTIGTHAHGLLGLVMPSENILVSCGQDGAVHAWDVAGWHVPYATVTRRASARLHGSVSALAAAGAWVVCAHAKQVVSFDPAGGGVSPLIRHERAVRAVSLASDAVFSCADDGQLRRASLRGGPDSLLLAHLAPLRCLATMPAGRFCVVAGSSDGCVFAVAGDGRHVAALCPP
jgi:hypothetical protein